MPNYLWRTENATPLERVPFHSPLRESISYRDQFIARFPESDIAFPVILIQEDDETPSVILNATEINQANNLQQLIVRLSEKIE